MTQLTSEAIYSLCLTDPEFQMASRHWTGGVRFEIGTEEVCVNEGEVEEGLPTEGIGVITISGPQEIWDQVLSANPPPPPRFMNDINIATGRGGLAWQGDRLTWWQYLPAIQRICELMRSSAPMAADAVQEGQGHGSFDSPIGRYLRIDLRGVEHRIYMEEAGKGIPLFCNTRLVHTGCNGGILFRIFSHHRSLSVNCLRSASR